MRLSYATVTAVLVAALLAGCKTKPPPTRAEIHQQSGTLTNLSLSSPWKAAPSASTAIKDNWLAQFEEPQLDALVAEALAHNVDLRIASLRVAQSREQVEIARAALRPNVSIFGTGGLNMGGGDFTSALQGLSLGASWEPDLWGRLRYGRNAALEDYASAEADYEFGRQSLAASVAKSWFAATSTLQEMVTAQQMARAAQELLELAEKRQQAGIGSEQDVALARASLGYFEDTAARLKLAHQQTVRALELLLGRYPAAELRAPQQQAKLPGDLSAGLPIEMLERRPDMIAAEHRVAAAFNRKGEAKAAQLPRIVLNANVAVVQSSILALKEDFKNPTGGAGAKLIAPLYRGGELKAQVRIRTLQQKEAVANYAAMALRALGDVENALAAIQILDEREKMLRRVLRDSDRALVLAQKRYQVGMGDLRAVQQQQLDVHSARMALMRVESEQRVQRVNLHLALGGSFESPSPRLTQTNEKKRQQYE